MADADWQHAVAAAAWAAIEGGAVARPDTSKIIAILEQQIAPHDRAAAAILRTHVLDAVIRSIDVGAQLGYALARTWPDGVDRLDGWPEAAARFAGLSLL